MTDAAAKVGGKRKQGRAEMRRGKKKKTKTKTKKSGMGSAVVLEKGTNSGLAIGSDTRNSREREGGGRLISTVVSPDNQPSASKR